MRLFRIEEGGQSLLSEFPETAMGSQVLSEQGTSVSEWLVVLGGQVAVFLGDLFPAMEAGEPLSYLDEPWLRRDERGLDSERKELFSEWLAMLEPFERSLDEHQVVPYVQFRHFPIGPFPRPPQPRGWTYGHLPFIGVTGTDDIFYRWEPWPISKRIDQATGQVAPDTFTAPMSEVQFMPTGFSAVARLALPGLLPACFRWELRPPPFTHSRCGASVPMYGQSGGGVEVAFQNGFKNVGPIANPVVLPAL